MYIPSENAQSKTNYLIMMKENGKLLLLEIFFYSPAKAKENFLHFHFLLKINLKNIILFFSLQT